MAEIIVTSLVSSYTQMPRIEILMETPRVQLSHLEAMDLAMNIMKCVNGAAADAFIYAWVLKRIPNAGEREALNLMRNFRDFRDELDKKERNR